MNLTDAAVIKVNGKEVQQIKIDGNIVYTAGYRIRIITNKLYILPGETATLTVICDDLPNTDFELYDVIDMTRTKIADLTTDSSGKATYNYTGEGVGEIGFLAVYGEKESNMVILDDYVPEYTPRLVQWPASMTYGDSSKKIWASVKDQHNRLCEGITVTFKEGDTILGTAVSNSSGNAGLALGSLGVGSHQIYAVIGSKSSSSATVTVNKANSSLNIEVPALVYSDNFSVTGILKDANENPISGATVRLKWTVGSQENSTTEVTNSDGEVTFATQAPTSITEYTFKLEFDGNANYNASESSTVERTVGKETSILNISSPTSPVAVTGSSFNVVGVLTDDDGTPIKGKWIEAYFDGSYQYVAHVTTSLSDGSFTMAIPTSSLSDGQHSLRINYNAPSTHTDANAYLTVVKSSFDGLSDLSLIGGSQILSYADEQQTPGSQYATLETQLMNGDSPATIAGVTVEFWDFTDESAPYFLTSDETDSNGKASFTYPSRGVGDVPIKAVCGSFSSEIYVEDCYLYDDASSNKSSKFIVNDMTLTHNTDHYEATTSVANGTVTLFENVDNYIATFDMKSSETGLGFGVFNSTSNYYNAFYCKMWGTTTQVYTSNASGTESNKKTVNHSRQNDWYNMTVTREGNSVTITTKRNGSQIFTYTQSISTGLNLGMIEAYANRTFSFKNIKVKAL